MSIKSKSKSLLEFDQVSWREEAELHHPQHQILEHLPPPHHFRSGLNLSLMSKLDHILARNCQNRYILCLTIKQRKLSNQYNSYVFVLPCLNFLSFDHLSIHGQFSEPIRQKLHI